jgi:hypothetical protein
VKSYTKPCALFYETEAVKEQAGTFISLNEKLIALFGCDDMHENPTRFNESLQDSIADGLKKPLSNMEMQYGWLIVNHVPLVLNEA